MKKFIIILIIIFVFLPKIKLLSNEIKDEIFKSIGARASGMAGAFTAVADDYSSFFWNPAGLVNLNEINLGVFYDSVWTGKQNIYGFNYSHPLFSDMSVSLSYIKILFNQSNFVDDFIYFSFATYLHEDKNTAFGLNFKLLNFSLTNYEFYGFTTAFDIGFMFFPDLLDKKIRFALSATDLDAKIKWSNNTYEKIPASYKAGACYIFDNSTLAAIDIIITDFDIENRILRTGFSAGVEKYFLNNIIGDIGIRTGVYYMEKLNLSFGLSYKRKEFALNYVFIPELNNFGQTHKLDFIYFIGEEIKKAYEKEIIPEIKDHNITMLTQSLNTMEFSLSQKIISPNNDGYLDVIEILLNNNPVKISGVRWKIRISDKVEKVIKEISGIEIIQSKVLWDGRDLNGKTVKDDDYTITYSFFAGEKLIWEKKRIVTVDTKPPLFKLSAYPKIFAPVKNSKFRKLQINIDFKDKDINLWTINILNDKNNIIRKISGEGLTEKINWNGDDALGNLIADGNYKIKLSAQDFAGNVFEQVENILVDTQISNYNMEPDRKIFEIGKEKVNLVSNKSDINKVKKLNVQILDYNKNILKIMNNLNAEKNVLTWNGTNEKNQYVKKGNFYIIKLLIEQINGIEIEKEYIIQSNPPKFEGVGIQLILAVIDFENKSYEIPIKEYGYLNQAADAVKKYAKNYFLILKGYAVDYENPEKNLNFSINRVKAVYDYLTEVKKINPENVYLTGYGDGSFIEGINKDAILKSGTRVEVELLTK